jgi:3-dehydroquinate dehydratase/shikimate dehydrogenase
MTLLIASVHGEIPEQIHGADLLEIRIDNLTSQEAVNKLPALLAASPVPTIITCRSTCEGGSFEGDEEERVAMYRVALDCETPPRYIDIEHEVLSRHPLMLDSLASESTGIILSWHDVTGRPKNLLQRAAQMQDVSGVDIVKMVWRARSLRDNLEAFSLLQSRQQPMIAMCMGEYGLLSRVLAPKFGSFAVFASVEGMEETAPSQPTTKVLRSLYHFDAITKETKVFGVIGNNVQHSASPAFHNAAFEAAGENAVYVPLLVPDGWEHLKATVLALRCNQDLHFSGASVTIPHKENALRLVDDADAQSTKAQAINTITIKDNQSIGNNTDVEALALLAPHAKRVLLLGGGGVARAAIVAMQSLGATVLVATRNKEQSKNLAAEFSCEIASEKLHDIDTLINCTPVGMQGGNDPQGNPANELAPSLELTPALLVIDTVYNPVETPLIQRANDAGCTTVTGDQLFRLQATAQQKIWQ